MTEASALATTSAFALAALLLGQMALAAEPVPANAGRLSAKARLGKQIFFDTALSNPPGQSCGTCHQAAVAFTDPNKRLPTSLGATPELKGSRNTPSALYAAFSPTFHFDQEEGLYVGGQFLDGRAATLKEQAKGPFVNPLEMANPTKETVVSKVRQASYAPLFARVYGRKALADTAKAYNCMADAIAAFERTATFARFTSKYDSVLAGKAQLTDQERRGRDVYENPEKGNCAACHPDRPAEDGTPPLFTDFTYDNLGVPRNPENPFYSMPEPFNPKGPDFVDLGLGAAIGDPAEDGKFKVPNLRNLSRTGPYMHNGYFKTLRGVVDFYNTRDIKPPCKNPFTPESDALDQGCWPAPEVAANVNRDELGALGLSEAEVDDLVAFLQTLTDGYQPTQ